MENVSALQDRHMHEVRLYKGGTNEQPSTIIGFSEGVVGLADDPELIECLTAGGHDIRDLPRDAMVVGTFSTRHVEIVPPLNEGLIPEIVETVLSNQSTPYMPRGLLIVDNRRGAIPSDRRCVTGPILGSHH